MARKLLFASFLLALVLTFVAAHHQLTNALPNMAAPPQHAPPLEQMAALASSGSAWQVVAGGGGRTIKLNDVSMVSPSEGWAGGFTGPSSYGVMMHYTNTTWSQASVPTGTYAIYGVSMISSTEGWAAGWATCTSYFCDHGVLMHYMANTGWQTSTLPAYPGLYLWPGFNSIDVKGTAGWIVGASDYPLQFDGTNWTSVQGRYSYDVSVVDANEAWAVPSPSGPIAELAHYTGGSWSSVDTGVDGYLKAIHMLDASNGWAVGAKNLPLPSGLGYMYQCVTARYDGASWSQVACPSSLGDIRLHSVYMRGTNDVWAVGKDWNTSGGVILHYDGSNWTRAAVPPGTPPLYSVKLLGTDDGWVVGDGGAILRLVGGNWVRVQGPSLTVGPVDAVSKNEAWYGGDAGQLYEWKDGIVVTHTSPLTSQVTALDMVSPTVGWAAIDRPVPYVFRYSDGTWIKRRFDSRVNAISMVGPDEGWFALRDSPGGLMHRTAEGWQAESIPSGGAVHSVSMLDSNHGWALRYSQAFTYTGGTWNTVTPLPWSSSGNLKVIAISPDEAWVAGYTISSASTQSWPASPLLYHFSAGAWTSVTMTDWLAFLDISKVSATEWWAAGRLATMEYAFLHYKDGTYTTIPAAGEDVIGISMLPDGTGFARGVGSLLKLKSPDWQVYLPVILKPQ